ncbi:MAG: DNA-3-methyladenine glycosylase [Bdellovibrio sp.]
MILPQDFYFADTETVAKALLGKVLNVNIGKEKKKARIVEVEAYLGIDDPACHTFKDRRTERTKSMYLDGGHTYVYLVYGIYYCMNFVTRTCEYPEAVLIRALQPLPEEAEVKKKDMKTNGPGKLCKFYHITKKHDGVCLWKKSSPLYVTDDDFIVKPRQIIASPRVGVYYAGEAASWPLRFYIKDSPFVSRR